VFQRVKNVLNDKYNKNMNAKIAFKKPSFISWECCFFEKKSTGFNSNLNVFVWSLQSRIPSATNVIADVFSSMSGIMFNNQRIQ
jgi:hypothetical protein